MSNLTSRQYPLVAFAKIGAADATTTITIPGGALLNRISAVVSTAFNGAATLTAGDGTTTFVSAEIATAAGPVVVDSQLKFYPTPATVTITLGGTPTAGAAYVAIEYVVVDRWSENQD
jgi:hypothetical protein